MKYFQFLYNIRKNGLGMRNFPHFRCQNWHHCQIPPSCRAVRLFCSLCEKQSPKKEVKCKSCNGNKGAHNYRALCSPTTTHWGRGGGRLGWLSGWAGGFSKDDGALGRTFVFTQKHLD